MVRKGQKKYSRKMCVAQLHEGKIFLQYLEMVLKYLQLYSEGVMTLCSSQDYAGGLKGNHRWQERYARVQQSAALVALFPEPAASSLHSTSNPILWGWATFCVPSCSWKKSCSWTQSSFAKPEIFTYAPPFSHGFLFHTLIIFLLMLLSSFSFPF